MEDEREAILFEEYLYHLGRPEDEADWLAVHSDVAGEFQALGNLAAALEVEQPDPAMLAAARQRSRRRLLDAAARDGVQPRNRSGVTVGGFFSQLLSWFQTPRWRAMPVMARAVLLVVLIAGGLMGIGAGVISAADDSLPGDPLYSVKRANEHVQITLTRNQMRRAELETALSAQRTAEVSAVLERARAASVDFEGEILQIQADRWVVGRFVVHITSETEIRGEPAMGSYVEVHAHAQPDHTLIAQVIEPEHEDADDESDKYQMGELSGILMADNGDTWIIDELVVQIGAQTEMEGIFTAGMPIKVEFLRLKDGSLLALEIEPADDLEQIEGDRDEADEGDLESEEEEEEDDGDDKEMPDEITPDPAQDEDEVETPAPVEDDVPEDDPESVDEDDEQDEDDKEDENDDQDSPDSDDEDDDESETSEETDDDAEEEEEEKED